MEETLLYENSAPSKSKKAITCSGCGFPKGYCFCFTLKVIDSDASFALVTHSKEFLKQTNTGFLLKNSLSNCQIYEWHRLNPPARLLQQIADPAYTPWLVFPPTQKEDECAVVSYQRSSNKRDLFIIVDATWQQAAKIVRKSPWLTALPRLFLSPTDKSRYVLRKNQQSQKVCTVEVGILLLNMRGDRQEALTLEGYFLEFMERFIQLKKGKTLTLTP